MSTDEVTITKVKTEKSSGQVISETVGGLWSSIKKVFINNDRKNNNQIGCTDMTIKVLPRKKMTVVPKIFLPKTCFWTALAPIGFNILLICAPLKSTPRIACTTDRLLISKSGDPNLTGADTYCGSRTIQVLSTENVMTFGAVSVVDRSALQFDCQLSARPVPKPCSCGIFNNTGTVYPMFVAIVHKDNQNKALCGGTIIDNRHVLTSALCIRDGTDNLLVKVGISESSPWLAHKTYTILYSVKHDKYSDRHFGFKDVSYDDYDIGLIRLSNEIEPLMTAGAACLPIQFLNFDFTGTNLTYLFFHNFTEYKTLDVQVVSSDNCDTSNSTVPEKTQLCNQPLLVGEKDMTYIESGGPVLYKDPDNGMLYVVGIVSQVSWQHDRTSHRFKPAYDVKVAPLLDWILKFTTEVIVDEYCQA